MDLYRCSSKAHKLVGRPPGAGTLFFPFLSVHTRKQMVYLF